MVKKSKGKSKEKKKLRRSRRLRKIKEEPQQPSGRQASGRQASGRQASSKKKERRCEGDICCQAVTSSGEQCSRKARLQFDLREGKKLFGYQIVPKKNCCFFCVQHLALLLTVKSVELSKMVAESQLSWDEYIMLYPEYPEKLMRDKQTQIAYLSGEAFSYMVKKFK